jgi:hypothetical protein
MGSVGFSGSADSVAESAQLLLFSLAEWSVGQDAQVTDKAGKSVSGKQAEAARNDPTWRGRLYKFICGSRAQVLANMDPLSAGEEADTAAL